MVCCKDPEQETAIPNILARRVAKKMCTRVRTYALILGLLGFSVLYAFSYLNIAVGVGPVIEAILKNDFPAFTVAGLRMTFIAALGALSSSMVIFIGDVFFQLVRTAMEIYLLGILFRNRAYYALQDIDRSMDDVPQRMTRDADEIIESMVSIIIGSPIFSGYLLTTSTAIYFLASLFVTSGYFAPLAVVVVFLVLSAFAVYATREGRGPSMLMSQAFAALSAAQARLAIYAEHVALLGGYLVERNRIDKLFNRVLDVSTLQAMYTVTSTFSSTLFFWMKIPVALIIPGVGWVLGFDIFRDPVLLVQTTQVLDNLLSTLSAYPLLLQEWSRLFVAYERVNTLAATLESIGMRVEEHITFTTSPSETLELIGVTVYRHGTKTPLVDALNLKIDANRSAVIVGPSGCGKSSLLRVVAGLWPGVGRIAVPSLEGCRYPVMFIPQRPYLPFGTIAFQLIYPGDPNNRRELDRMSFSGVTSADGAQTVDGQILVLLEEVGLGHITERLQMNVFSEELDWSTVLSIGEQQQIAIARALYHRPCVCIMDESTSDMSEEAEACALRALLKRRIALLSVAHRSSVQKFHEVEVRIDGTGAWTVNDVVK